MKTTQFPSPFEKKQSGKGLKGKVIKLKNKSIRNKLFQLSKNKELEDQVYNSIPVALNKYSWQQQTIDPPVKNEHLRHKIK